MQIVVLAVGKKHDAQLVAVINDYSERVCRTAKFSWEFIAPSGLANNLARHDESARLLERCKPDDTVWLLDEVGTALSSPELADRLEAVQNASTQRLVIIIGGAYGVDDTLRQRAHFTWSLSKLVFPHQIVRLLLAEQLYRAYEINRGSGYHHL